jgi:replicative DNA helicase
MAMGTSNHLMTALPYHQEAEETILASCMLSPAAVEHVAEHLTPAHLHLDKHRAVLELILAAHQQDQPIDPILLREQAEPRHHELITQLAATPVATTNIAHYCDIILEHAVRRDLITVGQNIARTGWEPPDDLTEAISQAETAVYDLANKREQGELQHVSKTLATTFAQLARPGGQVTGTPTGLKDLDTLTAGLQPGNLITVAARPGQGKSALALQAALHNALAGRPAAIFTLEMSTDELNQRSLAQIARVPLMRVRQRIGLTPTDHAALNQAGEQLQRSALYLDGTVSPRITDIRARARRLKQRQPDLALIVIDYLQLMVHAGSKNDNREQQVSAISRGLKHLARELEVPVMALAQLNRNVEHRGPEARPMLSDLRESGAIEQDSDLVIFIHRSKPTDNPDHTAEMLVAKHRNGPTGTETVAWLPSYAQFSDLAEEQ